MNDGMSASVQATQLDLLHHRTVARLSHRVAVRERVQLGKNRQKKHEAAKAAISSSNKMSGKEFEKELAKLQVELVRLQTWVQAKKARVIVVFEGRDTAGKGGVISRITELTSPRVFPPRGIACTL